MDINLQSNYNKGRQIVSDKSQIQVFILQICYFIENEVRNHY